MNFALMKTSLITAISSNILGFLVIAPDVRKIFSITIHIILICTEVASFVVKIDSKHLLSPSLSLRVTVKNRIFFYGVFVHSVTASSVTPTSERNMWSFSMGRLLINVNIVIKPFMPSKARIIMKHSAIQLYFTVTLAGHKVKNYFLQNPL